jgi:NTP pyrophosphatase (non-canonical NTP hydrolase)
VNLAYMQKRHSEWLAHNFPNQPPYQPLLGLVEEVGELAHAQLKGEQAIREGSDKLATSLLKIDAIGDIFIYLMSYCNASDFDLEQVVITTCERVWARDWKADPVSGGERA